MPRRKHIHRIKAVRNGREHKHKYLFVGVAKTAGKARRQARQYLQMLGLTKKNIVSEERDVRPRSKGRFYLPE